MHDKIYYTEINQVKENLNHDYFGITPVGNLIKLDSNRVNETNQFCFLA